MVSIFSVGTNLVIKKPIYSLNQLQFNHQFSPAILNGIEFFLSGKFTIDLNIHSSKYFFICIVRFRENFSTSAKFATVKMSDSRESRSIKISI